ncbi:carboxylate-amine ligase [Streptodolium elevatio]|uniref:Putative glutamate--cysteine ligase 2 n=1 Tax=Streptodolium elevatio TaxID=3157996 RepID=A0ABV3DKF0_9ACTN
MSGSAVVPWGATLGVEEEFLTVDPGTGMPVPAAAAVLGGVPAGAAAAELKPELLACQVEAATGVCRTLGDVRGQVTQARAALAASAHTQGVAVMSVGFAPVMADGPLPLTPGERYLAIERLYRGVVDDYAACGLHVHVGVADRETAVAVVNHLRPWLATLQVLTGNSAFCRGRDTGFASWRTVVQSRFPGFGAPPWCADAAAYDRAMGRQAAFGTTVDPQMTFWSARPSEHAPTVEVRAADAVPTADEAVLHAALVRALVVRARMDLDAGRQAAPVDDAVIAAAMWSAARHGLRGPAVDPARERQMPAAVMVHALLAHVRDALDEFGDRDEVHRLVSHILERGTGAERQRAAAASGGIAAVCELAGLPQSTCADPLPEAS